MRVRHARTERLVIVVGEGSVWRLKQRSGAAKGRKGV